MQKAADSHQAPPNNSGMQHPSHRCRQRPSSQAIPLPKTHVARTNSELQLYEDLNTAEWRDLSMFYRVVNGIRQRQRSASAVDDDEGEEQEVIMCDSSISRTRGPLVAGYQAQPQQSAQEYEDFFHRNFDGGIHLESSQHRQAGWLSEATLEQPFIPKAVLEEDAEDAGGWSITGYDEDDDSMIGASSRRDSGPPLASVLVEDIADRNLDEEEVFDMEL